MKPAETLANEPQTGPATAARQAVETAAETDGRPNRAPQTVRPPRGGAEGGAPELADAARRYLDAWERNQAEISLAGPPAGAVPGFDLLRR